MWSFAKTLCLVIFVFVCSNCSSLTNLSFPAGSTFSVILGRCFCFCSSLTSVNVRGSIESLGTYAFYNCSSLTSFGGCSNLANVNLHSAITSLGNCAFQNCSSLEEFTIPSAVESVRGACFYGECSSLKRLTYLGTSELMGSFLDEDRCGEYEMTLTAEYLYDSFGGCNLNNANVAYTANTLQQMAALNKLFAGE